MVSCGKTVWTVFKSNNILNVGCIAYSRKRWQGWKNLFKMLNVKCCMVDLFVLCLIEICYWVENLSCFCLFVFLFVFFLHSWSFAFSHRKFLSLLFKSYWVVIELNQLILKTLPRRHHSFIGVYFLSESSFRHVFPFFIWQKHRVRCNLPYDDESGFLKMQIISIKRTINKLLNCSPVRCCLVVLPMYSM